MKIDKGKSPVVVTGANGYIGSWIVKKLLEEGITVHATVRDPSNINKIQHLKELAENTKGSLKIFKADLLEKGSFAAAMDGCQVVFHAASPFIFQNVKDPESQLIRPAVTGTHNVLTSVNNCPSVKRVVLTSSLVAVYGDIVDLSQIPNGCFTEEHWNETSTPEHQPYSFSKTKAERTAWRMAKAQKRWDLLTVNPALVLGPSLNPNIDSLDTYSNNFMVQMANGTFKFGVFDLRIGVVDVRDVAEAHIKAAYTESASGRHVLVSKVLSLLEIGQILKKSFGTNYPFPEKKMQKFIAWLIAPLVGLSRKFIARNVGYPLKVDNSYSKVDLDINYRDAQISIVQHFQQLIEDGLIISRC